MHVVSKNLFNMPLVLYTHINRWPSKHYLHSLIKYSLIRFVLLHMCDETIEEEKQMVLALQKVVEWWQDKFYCFLWIWYFQCDEISIWKYCFDKFHKFFPLILPKFLFKYICMLLTVQFGDLILQNLDRVLTTCVIRSWQVQLYPKLRK